MFGSSLLKISTIVVCTENILNKEKRRNIMTLLFVILYTSFTVSQNTSVTEDAPVLNYFNSTQSTTEISKKSKPSKKKIADSLLALSKIYTKEGKYNQALRIAGKSLMLSKAIDAHKLIGQGYNQTASLYYYKGEYQSALYNFEKSIAAYKIIDFKKGIASSTNNKGAIYYHLGNYSKALEYYKKALRLNEAVGDTKQVASSIQNIGGIYLKLNDLENAMDNFQLAKKTYESTSDIKSMSQVLIGIGEIHLLKKNYTEAQSQFGQALKLARDVGAKQRILEALHNLAHVYDIQDNYAKSLRYNQESLKLAKELDNSLYISRSLTAMGLINNKLGKRQLAIDYCRKGLIAAENIETIAAQELACTCLYKSYKSLKEDGIALTYYERSIELKGKLQERQAAEALQNMEFEKQVLLDSIAQVEKHRKLQLRHQREVAAKEKQRNYLIFSGCFVLVIAGGLWSRLNYTKKSKARLQVEKDRSEHLLLNILPEEIAEELKEKGYVDAQDFETASILFTDFKSFTETAAKLSPQELVQEINVCFKAFDAIMETYGIEKIKTIGDAYMAAGGLPIPSANAVKNTILAAMEMQDFILRRKLKNESQGKPAFQMRVGIHVGPIVAGIVGVKKFQYDVWGDTVNTASRMESHGSVGTVNISQDTFLLVKDDKDLTFEYRGKIAAKGKGELEMYYVTFRRFQTHRALAMVV